MVYLDCITVYIYTIYGHCTHLREVVSLLMHAS